jgi:hypothetical protein
MQKKVIPVIESHMDKLERTPHRVQYQPGFYSGFLIRLVPEMKCKTGNAVPVSCIGGLIGELAGQNKKLENLLHRSALYNINNRIIRYGYLKAVRLSMGDMFELVTNCQQKHVILARRILMLQNLE